MKQSSAKNRMSDGKYQKLAMRSPYDPRPALWLLLYRGFQSYALSDFRRSSLGVQQNNRR